jgi:methionyl-tRNA formyltransferase
VLLQKETDIGPDDTVGSLYFDKLFQPGVDALVESVRLVREGAAPRIEQDDARATYEPPADDSNSGIDWSQPAQRVYDLVRGSNPTPGAHARLRGELVRIFDARMTADDTGVQPGTVIAAGDGIDIALNGGTLRALRLQPPGGKKMAAGEFAGAVGLAVGDRFEDGRAVSARFT